MLGALAKAEKSSGEVCLFFFSQQGTGLSPTTRQMAAALVAKKLGWIQHVVEEKVGSDFTVKPAARKTGSGCAQKGLQVSLF